jgi:hypothetical protein
MKDQHTPGLWDDDLVALIQAGDIRLLLSNIPPPRDCRVLTEPNFQHAKKCVNAHEDMKALLRKWLDDWNRRVGVPVPFARETQALLDGLDKLDGETT